MQQYPCKLCMSRSLVCTHLTTGLQIEEGGRRRKISVFWDRVSLCSGEEWERGVECADALCNSSVIVPIISRKTFITGTRNKPWKDVRSQAINISDMTADSAADYVLWDWCLALQLVAMRRKYPSVVLPVLVGDLKDAGFEEEYYTDFFTSDCAPAEIPDVHVHKLHDRLRFHLIHHMYACPITLTHRLHVVAGFSCTRACTVRGTWQMPSLIHSTASSASNCASGQFMRLSTKFSACRLFLSQGCVRLPGVTVMMLLLRRCSTSVRSATLRVSSSQSPWYAFMCALVPFLFSVRICICAHKLNVSVTSLSGLTGCD